MLTYKSNTIILYKRAIGTWYMYSDIHCDSPIMLISVKLFKCRFLKF